MTCCNIKSSVCVSSFCFLLYSSNLESVSFVGFLSLSLSLLAVCKLCLSKRRDTNKVTIITSNAQIAPDEIKTHFIVGESKRGRSQRQIAHKAHKCYVVSPPPLSAQALLSSGVEGKDK